MKTTKSSKKVPIKKVRLYNVAKNVIPIKNGPANHTDMSSRGVTSY